MFSQACVKNSVHEGCIPACAGADSLPWADTPQQTAIAADGTHPTGMHSCLPFHWKLGAQDTILAQLFVVWFNSHTSHFLCTLTLVTVHYIAPCITFPMHHISHASYSHALYSHASHSHLSHCIMHHTHFYPTPSHPSHSPYIKFSHASHSHLSHCSMHHITHTLNFPMHHITHTLNFPMHHIPHTLNFPMHHITHTLNFPMHHIPHTLNSLCVTFPIH